MILPLDKWNFLTIVLGDSTNTTPYREEVKNMENTTETKVDNSERIHSLLETLNAMPKGIRSSEGRKVRSALRKMGFYLSKQVKAETK